MIPRALSVTRLMSLHNSLIWAGESLGFAGTSGEGKGAAVLAVLTAGVLAALTAIGLVVATSTVSSATSGSVIIFFLAIHLFISFLQQNQLLSHFHFPLVGSYTILQCHCLYLCTALQLQRK